MGRGNPDQYRALLSELNEERAASLKRISGRLEQLITQLHGALHHASSLPVSERSSALARCRHLRKEAVTYRWYLEVQREAIGLTRHDGLDEFYRIPIVDN